MSELLNDAVNVALNELSTKFVYRKLGLCYDYPTAENVFPLKTLPKAGEAANDIPNTTGKDTGMYNCILNNALLFDGYASRFEIGFGTAQDEIIFDRLIGGTIRLGTVAPKNVIVRGLTGDGRYFYSDSCSDAALLWSFTAWRTVTTTSVAVESQQKLVNISSRWVNKLHDKDYKIREENDPIDNEGVLGKLKLCAILAVCSQLLKNEKWSKEFTQKFTGDFTIAEDASIIDLLIAQISLYMITEVHKEDPKVTAVTTPLMLSIGKRASKFIDKYKELDSELLKTEVDTNWRDFKEIKAEFTTSQKRFKNEADSVSTSVHAMYIVLYSGSEELIKEQKDRMIQAIKGIPWEDLTLANSLSSIASIHARGVDYKLWDEPLHEYTLSFKAETSLVADYLKPDYDDTHEHKAGHVKPPKKKPVIEISDSDKGTKKKRKRKRKTRPVNSNDAKKGQAKSVDAKGESKPKASSKSDVDKKDGAGAPAKRGNNKNRRNRRRRPSQPKKPAQEN